MVCVSRINFAHTKTRFTSILPRHWYSVKENLAAERNPKEEVFARWGYAPLSNGVVRIDPESVPKGIGDNVVC